MLDSPFRVIPIGKIDGQRAQRKDGIVDKGGMEESIRHLGILAPPVVVMSGNSYRLVAGAGRIATAKKMGIGEVWCMVLPREVEIDSPTAKLAFIDENLMRVGLADAATNSQRAARRKILEQLDPANTPLAKKKAGGKSGGRGKKKPGPKTGPAFRPSKQPEARKEAEAVHREEASAETTMELFADGQLKQSQVDQLVKIKDEAIQAEVALEAIGKTVGETKALVIAANAQMAAPKKQVALIAKRLKRVREKVSELISAIVECDAVLIDGISVGGIGGFAVAADLRIVSDAIEGLILKLKGKQ